MSLILEALKRSEAQRRLGEAPDLLAPPPEFVTTQAPPERSWRWPVGMLVGILLIAAVAGWWVRRGSEARELDRAVATQAASGADSVVATPDKSSVSPSGKSPARSGAPALLGIPRVEDDALPRPAPPRTQAAFPGFPTQLPATASAVPDPTAPLLPPDTVTGNSPVAVEPQRAPASDMEVVAPVAATSGTADPATPPSSINPDVAATPVLTPPAPYPSAPPTQTPQAPYPSASQAQTQTATPTPTPTPAPTLASTTPPIAEPADLPESPPSDVPERSDLPLAMRQSLPPLVLNMHLYRAAPAERVVILDGKRLHEGEASGEITVQEIRSDGVVLLAQGQRFLLSRLPR